MAIVNWFVGVLSLMVQLMATVVSDVLEMFSQQQGIHRLHTFSWGSPKIWVTFESEIWPGTGKCTCGPVYAGNTWTRLWKDNYRSIDTQPKNWEAVAWLSPVSNSIVLQAVLLFGGLWTSWPLKDFWMDGITTASGLRGTRHHINCS